jgi:colanic acid biosynthesis glycosyl transferase WcaI
MRIIVWGINYAPEQTGIGPYNTALCEFLAGRGHDVEMVTGFEYYPAWQKQERDRWRLFRSEKRNGVRVRRCWLYVPKRVRSLKRILHELSFVSSSLIRLLFIRKPDIFVVVSPPLLLGLAAAFLGFVKRAPFLFHVQDLQPDAAICLGMLGAERSITRLLYAFEALAYRSALRVSTISPGMLQLLVEKGVPRAKMLYFPNGIRLFTSLPKRGSFRQRHGISPSVFVILYSGNLGVKQGLAALLDAAALIEQENRPLVESLEFKFVIAGAGAGEEQLRVRVQKDDIGNVLLLPLQSADAYQEMLADADCCAITQMPGTGKLFFPSKLLTALAFGKPVLAIADADGDLACAVCDGNFGIVVSAVSPNLIADAARRLAGCNGELRRMSDAGLRFVTQFERNKVLGEFEAKLLSALREPAEALGSAGGSPNGGEGRAS